MDTQRHFVCGDLCERTSQIKNYISVRELRCYIKNSVSCRGSPADRVDHAPPWTERRKCMWVGVAEVGDEAVWTAYKQPGEKPSKQILLTCSTHQQCASILNMTECRNYLRHENQHSTTKHSGTRAKPTLARTKHGRGG